MKKAITIEAVRQMGYRDAIATCRESGGTATPDGGWDSWLINSIGTHGACVRFGENPAANEDGWTEAMSAKLQQYHGGAMAACEEIDAESDGEDC